MHAVSHNARKAQKISAAAPLMVVLFFLISSFFCILTRTHVTLMNFFVFIFLELWGITGTWEAIFTVALALRKLTHILRVVGTKWMSSAVSKFISVLSQIRSFNQNIMPFCVFCTAMYVWNKRKKYTLGCLEADRPRRKRDQFVCESYELHVALVASGARHET